ncbi:tRNA (adenosine(37)-N6)-dimethylallyltransferase MiaA [Thermophilibacter sp. ET337]|uniref:tRNA (adenosine(37)-N6)-dimethylallyltransferase MiaA n=1 Tax=Thermophilibacter sp. ET337 TaxID=2973084 RepID=UPI0021ABFAD0|nr:tRNA (adenosine(37)-N6)-dimethylallyltransferase MiaA [Thermophilibacter sp. ET337]MCR8907456.1 tRNA (adenosine(37)-N6)-dimethylallyltransferase MiaA [Thermophilibacter sp. ET337]
MSLPRVVCVVGPTASGKSVVADLVAEGLGSAVISVDAMQVYRGMDIGTAKTPPSERRVPLLMVDVADPLESYSVQLFQGQARACVDELLSRGRVPVLAGGTGLYLNAVIDEMSFPSGEKDDDRRRSYEALAAERGAEGLHALLASRDPESAALIHPNNVRRVVRALEMLDEGVSYARHHEGLHERRAHYDAQVWGLTMARERLYARIDARVDEMVSSGLVDEVRGLAARGLTTELTAGQAIGYKEVLEALAGACTMDEAIERVKQRSRRYAKRQLSWFRHDGRVRWIDLDETDAEGAARLILDAAGGA